MTEKSKKLKKGIFTEQDISILLQRYTANTVLALLQEVAQFEGGVKIDWNTLVKKSSTGISNAREYQMLWRHLAYRHSLLENFDNGAQPLDDDSDLEYELEAFPKVSSEASAEASACVKVLIASGLKSDSSHSNNAMVEAPLTINIPSGQLVKATSESSQLPAMRGMNITVPVSVQKQPVPSMTSAEALDSNGSVNGTIPARRKKKIWTEAEDLELVAAVQKYGEGNWANILRSESTWDRTASQLAQRWGVIRRKVGNLNLATTTASAGGVQLSEAQRAARIAMNLALDLPVKNTFIKSGEGTSSQRSFATKPSSKIQLNSVPKSQITVNKPVKPDLSSDPVRAAAVAAGARIATQSDAATLLRAAQAKNAVHIMPTVGSSIKSALPSSASSHTEAHSNVSVNLSTASVSTHPAVSPSGLRPALEKASLQSTLHNPISGTAMNVSTARANSELPSKQGLHPALEKTSSQSTTHHNPNSGTAMNVLTTQGNTELPLKHGLGPALAIVSSQSTQHNQMNVSSVQANTEITLKQDVVILARGIKSGANVAKVLLQDNGASVAGKEPSKQVKQENKETKPKTQEHVGKRLKVSPKIEVAEGSDGKDKMDCISVSKDENHCAGEGQVAGVARLVAEKKL